MPRAGKSPPAAAAAASESSPAPAAAEGETPPGTVDAGVRAREEGDGVKEMEVKDCDEVEPKEATGVESVEEEPEEEDPDAEESEEDPEEVEEDPDEAEEDADEGEGNEEEAAATKEWGDEERAMAMVLKEGGGEDTGMEPAVVEEPEEAEEEEPEEEEKLEEGVMEADATKVSGEGATADDMNELHEEGHEESGDEGTHGDSAKDGVAGQLSADGDAQNDELDPSLLVLGSVSVENAKDFEIFVGGLPKDCAEEDITMVFSQFWEIESIRIIKHPTKKKSNCIAFVRYTNTEAAKKALAEFKDGVEVKGKRIRVSASQGNNTLYLGNICRSWTKDQVLNTLKSIGIEGFEMSLPGDPDTGGRNRGFAFLKFAAHDNAEAAFQQLQQPDALFGIDRSAKSARTPTESTEEISIKVKTVYLEHVPLSWDERKMEKCCEGYGEIQYVRLLRKSKKKIISFVEFSSRKSALACVEGINNAKIGGEVKLVASLARPRRKIQLDKKSEGGFKVKSGATSEDADKSVKKNDQKKKVVVKKNSPQKLPKGDVSKPTSQVDAEVPQTSSRYKGKRKAGKSKNTSVNERPSKKARKNRDVLTRPSNKTRHGGYARAAYAEESAGNMKRSAGPQYATSNQSNPSVGSSSRSKPNARDLQPHAGYIPPANCVPANRVQITYVHDQPRTAPSNIHHIDGLLYVREIGAPQPADSGYTSNPQYQGGYAYTYLPPPPASGSYHPGTGAYSPQRRYY